MFLVGHQELIWGVLHLEQTINNSKMNLKDMNTYSRQEAEPKLNLQVQRNIQADEEHSEGTAAYQMHLD